MTGLYTILAKLYQSKRGNANSKNIESKNCCVRKVYIYQHCSSRKRGTASKLCQLRKMISAQKRLLQKLTISKKNEKRHKKSNMDNKLKRCQCKIEYTKIRKYGIIYISAKMYYQY